MVSKMRGQNLYPCCGAVAFTVTATGADYNAVFSQLMEFRFFDRFAGIGRALWLAARLIGVAHPTGIAAGCGGGVGPLQFRWDLQIWMGTLTGLTDRCPRLEIQRGLRWGNGDGS